MSKTKSQLKPAKTKSCKNLCQFLLHKTLEVKKGNGRYLEFSKRGFRIVIKALYKHSGSYSHLYTITSILLPGFWFNEIWIHPKGHGYS